jgi:capsular polysaccharide biosynthesis protein/Mrp family chromosome partitioning ATPase
MRPLCLCVVQETASPPEPGLGDYIAILLRRLPLMLAVLVGVTVAAGAVALAQTKQYTANGQVLIQSGPVDATTGTAAPTSASDATQVLQTEIKVITGQRVLLLVQKQVGASAPTASVSQVPNANVLQISVTDPKPADAVKVVNAYIAAYLNVRKQDQLTALGAQITAVQNQLVATNKLMNQLNFQIAATPPDQLAAAQVRYQPQQQSLQKRIDTLSAQYDSLRIAAGTATGGVSAVGPVKLPTTPSAPSKTKTVGLGFVAGLVLGIGLALLVEYLDGSVKDARDLARTLPTVPILAVVPKPKGRGKRKFSRRKRGDADRTLVRDAAAEQAYETAAIAIAAQEREGEITSLVIAGPEKPAPAQAIGLAVAMTNLGGTVVLVDASPRGHTLSDKLVQPDRGLAAAVADCSRIVKVPSNPRLFVLGSGQDPQSHLPPAPELRRAIAHLGAAAQVSVLSADPVVTYSDAMILARETSGTILVARNRRTTRRSLQDAVDRLAKVQADVIGVILDEG